MKKPDPPDPNPNPDLARIRIDFRSDPDYAAFISKLMRTFGVDSTTTLVELGLASLAKNVGLVVPARRIRERGRPKNP